MNGYDIYKGPQGIITRYGRRILVDDGEVAIASGDRGLICICKNVPELIKMAIDIHQKGGGT